MGADIPIPDEVPNLSQPSLVISVFPLTWQYLKFLGPEYSGRHG
jgi:hypothetical protein